MASIVVYDHSTKSYDKFYFEILKIYGRFPLWKTANNNDDHRRPHTETQIEESSKKL